MQVVVIPKIGHTSSNEYDQACNQDLPLISDLHQDQAHQFEVKQMSRHGQSQQLPQTLWPPLWMREEMMPKKK